MKYTIDEEVLAKLTKYLLSCPAGQVYDLLKALETAEAIEQSTLAEVQTA